MMSLFADEIPARMDWTGHGIRMQGTHLPKELVSGELKSGKPEVNEPVGIRRSRQGHT